MLRLAITGICVVFLAGCYAGSEEQSLAQCPGNHNDDSLLVWQDRMMEMIVVPGITGIGPHPTRDCISIGVGDSSLIGPLEERLQELGVPRDAVVISESTE